MTEVVLDGAGFPCVPTVVQALNAVMADVQAIGKHVRNEQQGFYFRGVDAVVNAVGPALRAHGVVVVPLAAELTDERYQSRKEAQMRGVTVKMGWRFYGPAGDHIEATTYGEAADAGDKAVAKAQSVAYRVVLLQALCIPTGDRDPDADAHERADPTPPQDPAAVLRAAIKTQGHRLGWSIEDIADDFASGHDGVHISSASVEQLTAYRDLLTGMEKPDA